MKRTYLDANVLIAAFRGEEQVAQRALGVLDDPDRKLVVSDYLRLEIFPKPTFLRRKEEIDFMQEIFDGAGENIDTSPELTRRALEFASKYDISPIDALHVGAAAMSCVDELITLENPTKPICRVKEVNVVSIHSESEAAQ
jgi:predicted nucleic acid-binding protein